MVLLSAPLKDVNIVVKIATEETIAQHVLPRYANTLASEVYEIEPHGGKCDGVKITIPHCGTVQDLKVCHIYGDNYSNVSTSADEVIDDATPRIITIDETSVTFEVKSFSLFFGSCSKRSIYYAMFRHDHDNNPLLPLSWKVRFTCCLNSFWQRRKTQLGRT